MPAKSKAQFRAMQAAAHGHSTLGIPAKVGKEFVKETPSAKKLPERKAKYQHSPDRYDPESFGEPKRLEYSQNPTNYTTAETPKAAGSSRGKIQESDGTGNLRAEPKSKSAAMPGDSPSGKTNFPGGVQSYNDAGELP